MKFFSRRTSLSTDFLFFSFISFIAIIFLSIGFWLQVFHEEVRKKRDQLALEAMRIDSVISDTMDYVAQYTAFIGEKIAAHKNPHDLAFIASLMADRPSEHAQEHNFYYTTTFDWVTPEKWLLVSNKMGILSKPFDMRDRDYLTKTSLYPWTMQLSAPRIGGLSGRWILPAGMGITDDKSRFLGSVTLGFTLSGLTQKIAQHIDGNTHYLMVTDDMRLVLGSPLDNNISPDPQFSLDSDISKNIASQSRSFLATPFTYHGINFSYYRKLDKYPYIILTGYDVGMEATLFNQIVISRSIGLWMTAFFALGMLYLMRGRLIKPVMELAEAADRISKGKRADFKETYIHEVDSLAKELQKISDYIQAEHLSNERLSAQKRLLEHQAEQLQEITKEAFISRDEAIRANLSKSEFLANMSHELRTPMNAIVGLSEILSRNKVSAHKQAECFNTLRASSHQLLSLINSLLDLSKIDNEHFELEHIPFNLKNILEEVIAINTVRAKEKGIMLTMHYTGIEEQVIGDPLRLKQVLLNLVSNAIKFTESGYVALQANCQVSQDKKNAQFKIDVKDSGIGIEDKHIDNIFNKFTQADASITRKYGGTGLGLAISKGIINAMGGNISVSTVYGRGSCFTVTLSFPMDQSHKIIYPVFGSPAPESPLREDHSHKQRILLVEDYKANILVATAFLDDFGYAHSIAHNGQEALQMLKSEEFALVLMDVQMPVMDGLETTYRLRIWEKQQGKKPVPIIGMTAHALAGDRERCLAAGMDDYISKPFDPVELSNTIKKYIDSSVAHVSV